jgi:hypothetical protein
MDSILVSGASTCGPTSLVIAPMPNVLEPILSALRSYELLGDAHPRPIAVAVVLVDRDLVLSRRTVVESSDVPIGVGENLQGCDRFDIPTPVFQQQPVISAFVFVDPDGK